MIACIFRAVPCALLASLVVAAPALADDPKDPAMRSAAARARDHELTRQLNLGQLAAVRERDAGYAAGWAATREAANNASADYPQRNASHRQAVADYDAAQADYARRMAAWRHQVAACQGGDWDACR